MSTISWSRRNAFFLIKDAIMLMMIVDKKPLMHFTHNSRAYCGLPRCDNGSSYWAPISCSLWQRRMSLISVDFANSRPSAAHFYSGWDTDTSANKNGAPAASGGVLATFCAIEVMASAGAICRQSSECRKRNLLWLRIANATFWGCVFAFCHPQVMSVSASEIQNQS